MVIDILQIVLMVLVPLLIPAHWLADRAARKKLREKIHLFDEKLDELEDRLNMTPPLAAGPLHRGGEHVSPALIDLTSSGNPATTKKFRVRGRFRQTNVVVADVRLRASFLEGYPLDSWYDKPVARMGHANFANLPNVSAMKDWYTACNEALPT